MPLPQSVLRRKYNKGSQISASNASQITGTKIYNSLTEAIHNGSTRYRDKDGRVKIIEFKNNSDLKGSSGQGQVKSIEVKDQSKAGKSRIDASYRRPSRNYSATVVGNVPGEYEYSKVGEIARKGQEYHHMMDLDSYKDFFEGLDPTQKEQLRQQLGKKGFFPGDDRRNYVGLVGNKMMIRGQNNIILGSEHQGDIHPRLNKLRKEYPLPSPEELGRMSVEQRYEAMMPHLTRDRAQLQEVIRTRRRPKSKIGVPRAAANVADIQIKPSMARKVGKFAGPAAKYATPVLAGAALLQGKPAQAAEVLIDAAVGDITANNTANRSVAEELRLVDEAKRKAKFRKEVEPQMGASKNVQRETSRKRQERLRRERRSQETNPLAEVGTRAMQWLQERYR